MAGTSARARTVRTASVFFIPAVSAGIESPIPAMRARIAVYPRDMADSATIEAVFETLAAQPFRARFHLRGREAAMVELRGMDVIERHARELLAKKLAPA